MLKMLSTQTGGLLQRIATSQEDAIEETARLLAQATIGQGKVYFIGIDELQAIELNARFAEEKFFNLAPWSPEVTIEENDRVCIFTRSATDARALAHAKYFYDAFIPFSVIATEKAEDAAEMSDYAYTYISTNLKKGLLPNDLGERIVVPHTIAALFIYEAIKLAYDEMVSED